MMKRPQAVHLTRRLCRREPRRAQFPPGPVDSEPGPVAAHSTGSLGKQRVLHVLHLLRTESRLQQPVHLVVIQQQRLLHERLQHPTPGEDPAVALSPVELGLFVQKDPPLLFVVLFSVLRLLELLLQQGGIVRIPAGNGRVDLNRPPLLCSGSTKPPMACMDGLCMRKFMTTSARKSPDEACDPLLARLDAEAAERGHRDITWRTAAGYGLIAGVSLGEQEPMAPGLVIDLFTARQAYDDVQHGIKHKSKDDVPIDEGVDWDALGAPASEHSAVPLP